MISIRSGVHNVSHWHSIVVYTDRFHQSHHMSSKRNRHPNVKDFIGSLDSYTGDGYYLTKYLFQNFESLVSDIEEHKKRHSGVLQRGRRHYELKDDATFMNESREFRSVIQHLSIYVDAYLGNSLPFDSIEKDTMLNEKSCLTFISTIQLVESHRLSEAQVFHADNSSKGLTFVIPLCNQTAENGPTELLTQTHGIEEFCQLKNIHHGKIVAPKLQLQDLLVFDSRLLHRGLPNSSDSSRSILVIRYDCINTRPPGMSTFGAMVRHYGGLFIYSVRKSLDNIKSIS